MIEIRRVDVSVQHILNFGLFTPKLVQPWERAFFTDAKHRREWVATDPRHILSSLALAHMNEIPTATPYF